MLKVRVYGQPVPQGSAQAYAVRKAGKPTGRVVVTADNKQTKTWRQHVMDATWEQLKLLQYTTSTSPVGVSLTFILPRPAGHYGTGSNAARVRPGAPAAPAVSPDLDKLCRAVLDALTDAGVWRDDAQVTRLAADKVYAGYDERPGVMIEVWPHG